ncbi:MAG: tRNA uridine-5-carboxymethylaminomethyl(34) synthesis enzyme MnmG [Deltaproteobacteria bacterium]|nr:MAG: tRNA uridine-5-carboxymethylaminomethyl(34) synthesis enzyme MnmG [Deltaproteobacteria bacterium]
MKWDVIIVGGGHAGCEASVATSSMGMKTLLITGLFDRVSSISCNPAIGGVGKGHLVKEIDALGGKMAQMADRSGIHFQMLNASKGPAVRATRCQIDLEVYRLNVLCELSKLEDLTIIQSEVAEILVKKEQVIGVKLVQGEILFSSFVILCTGTFLNGKIHLGDRENGGGRIGESSSNSLALSLYNLGIELGRLKTGTCPRLDSRSVNLSCLEEQRPQDPAPMFSFSSRKPFLKQVSCFLTSTNAISHCLIHEFVMQGLSPIFNGKLSSKGPRYCPSIEDKVERFPHKESHLIFLEPQGIDSTEYYINGLSTSLPPKAQIKFLRSIKGLETARVTRWGYAVEYDFVKPTQLDARLALKSIKGFFLAGQINGTTGYEEAAAQGLVAGVNVALEFFGKEPLILCPSQSYIGVMVNDLVHNGTEEPYRMLTSRAQYRLYLREDNVYQRLVHFGYRIGLLSSKDYDRLSFFEESIAKSKNHDCAYSIKSRIDTEDRYSKYLIRMQKEQSSQESDFNDAIPECIFEMDIPGLSREMSDKIKRYRPRTFCDLSKIYGVTPIVQDLFRIIKKKITNII